MQFADSPFQRGITSSRGLECDANFRLVLELPLPDVEALDLFKLRAGSEFAFDDSAGQAFGVSGVADRGDDSDRFHNGSEATADADHREATGTSDRGVYPRLIR